MRLAARDRRRLNWVLSAIAFAGSVALIRDTYYQGQDFEVFWRAARHLLAGRSAYDVFRDGAMVYKYPPWTLPFFFPLAFLPLEVAKWIWGVVQVSSLAWCARWCRDRGASLPIVAGCIAAFWGIWAVHALDGQVNLVMVAVALWAWGRRDVIAIPAILIALSTKAFTLLPALFEERFRKAREAAITLAIVIVLLLPATRVGLMFELTGWQLAAGSGSDLFGSEKIYGRDNQGLPALAVRILGAQQWGDLAAIILWMAIAAGVGSLWQRYSARLSSDSRWAGWLAIAAICHPLAWFHVFALVFPACVLAVQRSWKRDLVHRVAAIAAVVAIGLITPKTLGGLGEALEMASIKSLGTIAALVLLVR